MRGSSPMRRSTPPRSPWRAWWSTPKGAAAPSPHRACTTCCRPTSSSNGIGRTENMLRIDRRLIAHFDWPLLVCTLLIIGCGLTTVLSATHTPGHLMSNPFARQLMWAGLGLIGLLVALTFDYHRLDTYGY